MFVDVPPFTPIREDATFQYETLTDSSNFDDDSSFNSAKLHEKLDFLKDWNLWVNQFMEEWKSQVGGWYYHFHRCTIIRDILTDEMYFPQVGRGNAQKCIHPLHAEADAYTGTARILHEA